MTQPDFAFDGMASYAGVRADLALVELDAAGAGGSGGAVRAGRRSSAEAAAARHRLLRPRPAAGAVDRGALRLASAFGGVAALDCAVTYGASGAPVCWARARRLVAVVSAMGQVLATDGKVTLAVLVAARDRGAAGAARGGAARGVAAGLKPRGRLPRSACPAPQGRVGHIDRGPVHAEGPQLCRF